MKLAIHQPEFMPWLGFFFKMGLADHYVIFDHVQFKKRYFENRNRIVSPEGEVSYICVPVKTKGKFDQAIKDVEIDNTQQWKRKITNKIEHYYRKAPHFDIYYEDIHKLITEKEYIYLMDLNISIINYFRSKFHICNTVMRSSEMNLDGHSGSELIMKICTECKATDYLCGPSGRDYLKLSDFIDRGVRVQWMDYASPRYKQLCSEFYPNLSALDLLMNHGGKSTEIIYDNQAIKEKQECIY